MFITIINIHISIKELQPNIYYGHLFNKL